ncbi:hypothetical protein F383_23003 [Gossypium arboreum]|uniref:Uncharacterized protein n=1 Tax=Gossypium arboreum TaxID=29729 RepID=A0A0B0MI69_GOSAR|nr:hypothetical protein F383_23003 [Gossypium arboreum]
MPHGQVTHPCVRLCQSCRVY